MSGKTLNSEWDTSECYSIFNFIFFVKKKKKSPEVFCVLFLNVLNGEFHSFQCLLISDKFTADLMRSVMLFFFLSDGFNAIYQ